MKTTFIFYSFFLFLGPHPSPLHLFYSFPISSNSYISISPFLNVSLFSIFLYLFLSLCLPRSLFLSLFRSLSLFFFILSHYFHFLLSYVLYAHFRCKCTLPSLSFSFPPFIPPSLSLSVYLSNQFTTSLHFVSTATYFLPSKIFLLF